MWLLHALWQRVCEIIRPADCIRHVSLVLSDRMIMEKPDEGSIEKRIAARCRPDDDSNQQRSSTSLASF